MISSAVFLNSIFVVFFVALKICWHGKHVYLKLFLTESFLSFRTVTLDYVFSLVKTNLNEIHRAHTALIK